jgi:type I restriction enzyme S subunit
MIGQELGKRDYELTPDLPDGFQMTELGPLPKEWRVVRLGEVVEKTRQIDPYKKPDWSFKYVDVSSIDNESLRITSHQNFTGKEAPSRARKQISAGDVLFATVRPYLRRIAIVPSELDGHICSTAFCVLRAKSEIDACYLFFVVSHEPFVQRVAEHQRGSSYPAVTDQDVLREVIPLPPLAEQRAIAHVLRTVQRAKEATEGVIAALRELKKSLMQHLFTYGSIPVTEREQVELHESKIGPLPSHWRVVRLGEVAETTSGGTPSREVPEFFGGTIPWVKSGELNDTLVTRTEETITEDGLRNSNAKIFQKGTLLIAMYGATAGKVGILAIPATTNQAICAILPDTSLALQDFLFYALIRQRDTLLSQRYGGAQPNLNQTIIRSFPIHLPPLDEQREIARMLQAVDAKIAAEQARREALEGLFKTMLQELMSGKRRVGFTTENTEDTER